MTVAENIFLGSEPRRWAGLIDWPSMYEQAAALLERFSVKLDPSALVKSLGVGQKQLVEIAKQESVNEKVRQEQMRAQEKELAMTRFQKQKLPDRLSFR